MLPRQASEPAGGQAAHALPRLRLTSRRLSAAAGLASALVSGVLLWLALPPADLGPLAFVALTPVLWAVRGHRARRGALLGYIFGLAYFAILMSWLLPLTTVGWLVLAAGQAFFAALFFAYAAAVWRDDAPVRTALFLGAGWAAVEWLRGTVPFGGFTWGGLGYTQHDNPLTLPLASVLGVWGISFVVVAVNALILAALVRAGWGRATRLVAVAAVLAAVPVAIPAASPHGKPVDVAVVQGNVPEELAVESRIIEDRVVAENHGRLHLGLRGSPPDLAVWPENALDDDPTRDPTLGALVTRPVRAVGAPTLVGAITQGDDGRRRNENLLYDGEGRVVNRYVKNHLVPYGEYVPFRNLLENVISDIDQVPFDFAPGHEPGRFAIPAGEFASVICFENSFPDLVRRFVTPETGFLVVSTNNATFGRGPAADQHVAMSELRAVETGRWVVHAAISGVSAVVDAEGNVLTRTDLFEPATLRADIPQASGQTIFGRIGGWLPALFALAAALALVRPRRARRRAVSVLPKSARIAVVLPTYDEAATVEEVVRRVLAVGEGIEAIVVDDSSPDGTADIVRGLLVEDRALQGPGTAAERNGRIRLLERPAKQGLASAYLDGFALAFREGFDLVVEMDADLSHDPDDLRALLAGAGANHVTIGSRYVAGGAVENWSLARRALSRAGNVYARVWLGLPVADATSGYRAYRADALRELIADPTSSEGYAFQIELAYRAWRRGMSVGEVPITFRERRAGRSKLSRGIVIEALLRIPLWAVRDRLLRRSPPRADGTKTAERAPASPGREAEPTRRG